MVQMLVKPRVQIQCKSKLSKRNKREWKKSNCTSYFTDASAFLGQVKTFVFLRVRLLWSCSDAVRYVLATGFFLLFSRVLGTFSPHSNSVAQGIKSICHFMLRSTVSTVIGWFYVKLSARQVIPGGKPVMILFIWLFLRTKCHAHRHIKHDQFYLFAEYTWVPDKKSYRLR